MEGEGKVTINHTEIKKWVEKFNGKPQIIDDPSAKGDIPGLRINFPDDPSDNFLGDSRIVKDVTWKEFFKHFENQRLAFIIPDTTGEKEVALGWNYRLIKREVP